jgi:aerobic-type carbon monoxide dehydrogenase small subunit (CoxS/CutS family)
MTKTSQEEPLEETKSSGMSRRDFLRNAGVLMGTTAVGSVAILSACKGGETVTQTQTRTITTTTTAPGGAPTTITTTVTTPPVTKTVTAETEDGEVAEAIIRLNINGSDIPVMVRPNWTLQQVLNDKLGLIGAKEWCDAGACGSCTVIMDGRPVLSCMALAIECVGRKIETVEGIAKANHPLIEAYKNNNAMQCGYCTPGFVVTAKALLDKNPNPSREQIINALSANLCRCSTYPQHVPAVLEAAGKLGGA